MIQFEGSNRKGRLLKWGKNLANMGVKFILKIPFKSILWSLEATAHRKQQLVAGDNSQKKRQCVSKQFSIFTCVTNLNWIY